MVISDVTHPKGIFRDSDMLASLGIKPYREVTPDSRYYHNGAFTVDESGDDSSSNPVIAYCFHSVDGYSKVGSYTGNNNADGTFVYTGFRPAWLLVKRTDDNGNWYTWDSKRATYNVIGNRLYMDGTGAEATTPLAVDFTSNGFKLREDHADMNAAVEHIYFAFAKTPFKYSNAR